MAIVTVTTATTVAWLCQKCGTTLPLYRLEDPDLDAHGVQPAVRHEQVCGGDVRISALPGRVDVTVEGPVGST